MRKTLLSATVAILLFTTPCWARPSTLFDAGLELDVPPVFRELDDVAVSQMFAGTSSHPGAVFATPDSETRISLTLADSPIEPDALEEIKTSLRAKVEAGPPATFARDEMVVLHDSPWFRLTYEVNAGTAPKRETVMGSVLRGNLLFMVISTPLEDKDLLEADIEALIGSLAIVKNS